MKKKYSSLLLSMVFSVSLCVTGMVPFTVSAEDTEYADDDYAYEESDYAYEEAGYEDFEVSSGDYVSDDGLDEYPSEDDIIAADDEEYEETDDEMLDDSREEELSDSAFEQPDAETVYPETEESDASAELLTDFSESETEFAAEEAMMESDDVVASGTCGSNLKWVLTGPENDMTLTITGTGEMTSRGWSAYSEKIKNVILPEGLRNICDDAFYNFTSLTSIEIPDSVTEIGFQAFMYCSSLTSVQIPDGVTEIGGNTFWDCSSLTSVQIPDSVTKIGYSAFEDCSSLTSVQIPDSVTEIESSAFEGCSSLTSVQIPDSVTEIGVDTFLDCSSLTSVQIPDSVTKIGGSAFEDCSSLTSVQIPDSVTEIKSSAFKGCSSLRSIDIPDGVTEIESSAFSDCSSLTSVQIPDSVTEIESRAFKNCSSLTSIQIPESVEDITNYAFSGCGFTTFTFPKEMDYFSSAALSGCLDLETVNFPEKVGTVSSDWGFQEMPKLKAVVLPEGIYEIIPNAFSGCTSLQSVTLPSTIVLIRGYAFSGCTNLVDVTIPASASVKTIYGETFSGCTALKELTLPNSVEQINKQAFMGCENLSSILIPKSVTGIAADAFSGCPKLTIAGWIYSRASVFANTNSIPFRAVGGSIANTKVSGIQTMTYTGEPVEQAVTLKYLDWTLKPGTDYEVTYENNINAGTATVTITGKGDFTDTVSKTFSIKKASLTNAEITGIVSKVYTGSALTQTPVVKLGTQILNPGTDYGVACKNNINAGTATVTITGKGNFTDTVSKTFSIEKASLTDAGITGIVSKVYTGSALTQIPVVKTGTQILKSGTDYNVTYKNNINVGTATVTITGKGNFIDTVSNTFTIKPASLTDAEITGIVSKKYTGSALTQKPLVKLGAKTLVKDIDYSLAYKNNINAGEATITIKGVGNYSGTVVEYFTINPASVKNATVTGIVAKVYTGSALTQTPVVKIGTKTLKLDTDYYLAYKNNINPGRATIAIKGKGNYNNVAVKYFAVKPKPSWIDKLTTPKTKQITVKWGKRPQISGYQLEISTKKDFSSGRMQKNVYDPSKLSLTVTVSKAKTTYYVRIRTFKKTKDKTYFSAWSATKTIQAK